MSSSLLGMVHGLLRSDGTSPSEDVLFFMCALHKALEPRVSKLVAQDTLPWHVPPPSDGVGIGCVYVDGSRLSAEHKYCGLVARQG